MLEKSWKNIHNYQNIWMTNMLKFGDDRIILVSPILDWRFCVINIRSTIPPGSSILLLLFMNPRIEEYNLLEMWIRLQRELSMILSNAWDEYSKSRASQTQPRPKKHKTQPRALKLLWRSRDDVFLLWGNQLSKNRLQSWNKMSINKPKSQITFFFEWSSSRSLQMGCENQIPNEGLWYHIPC